MGKKTIPENPPSAKALREARLKSALKANLQRRKAQKRARAVDETGENAAEKGGSNNNEAG